MLLGQFLSHQRFADALYMLVDDWSEGVGPVALFMEFLETIYQNVTEEPTADHGWQGRQLKPLEEVGSMAEDFDRMRAAGMEEGRKASQQAIMQRRRVVHGLTTRTIL